MGYVWKTKPYAHQVKAVKRLLRQGYGGALLMEPRTGKTKTTVDWLSILNQQGKLDRALVVCPNRVMGTWLAELLAHSPRRVHVTVWDKDARKQGVPPTPPGYELYVVIINYDAFGVPGRRTASGRRSKASGRFKTRALLMKWLAGRPAACVLDESHKIKSPSGKVSNMLVSMRDAFAYRVILTGTPQTKAKRAHDIYMQWQFLNPDRFSDVPTVKDFKERYGRWISRNGFPQWVGARNLTELHSRMRKDAVMVRRDECFDLPPREDVVVLVDLFPATRKAYREMAEEMVTQIEEGVFAEAPITLVQSLRLQQITSGFITDDQGNLHRLGLEKANALESLLEDQLDKDQKVVVAARWKEDLNLIEEMCQGMGYPHRSIRGGVKRRDSDDAVVWFRELEGPGVMVVQPQAAGLGLDFSTAAHMVWFSHTLSWVDFTQCCDRIALSRSSTTFTHIVARGTVDETVLSTLAGDGDIGRAILSKPGELVNGHPLNLDDASRLQGVGLFQYTANRKR